MYLLEKFRQQNRRSMCFHQVSEPLFSCFIRHYYSDNSFFGETICNKYLNQLSSVHGIKFLEEKSKQLCCFEIFCANSFNDSSLCLNLWCVFSPKTILIFLNEFLSFRFDNVSKQRIVYLSSYRSKSYASVVLCDPNVSF